MLEVIVLLLVIALVVVIVAGWYWGIPFAVTLLFPDLDFWMVFAVWYIILIVRLVSKNMRLQNEIKSYEAIKNMLGGKK